MVRVNTLIERGRLEEAMFLMDDWRLSMLASYLKFFPHHRTILNNELFNDFWASKRESLRLPQSDAFRFEKSTTLSDMDFVIGYLYYLLALESNEQKDYSKYQTYKKLALSFSSIHAWYLVIHELIAAPVSNITTYCDNLVETLNAFNAQSSLYGTPGYLLLSKTYLHLGLLVATHHEEKDRQIPAFKLALKNLELARLDEKRSASDIHNAYFGNGLGAGNPFGIDSMDMMLEELRKLLTPMVATSEQDSIVEDAKYAYKTSSQKPEIGDDSVSERDSTDHIPNI